MERLIPFLLLVGSIFCLITYLISKFTKKTRWAKYIPSLIALALGCYNIYLGRVSKGGMEDLAYLLMAMLLFAGTLFSIITAIAIDVYPKIKNRK